LSTSYGFGVFDIIRSKIVYATAVSVPSGKFVNFCKVTWYLHWEPSPAVHTAMHYSLPVQMITSPTAVLCTASELVCSCCGQFWYD